MNIGIIGFGVVGKAHYNVFIDKSVGVFINDPLYKSHSAYRDMHAFPSCDLIFICVPTPYSTEQRQVDASILFSVMNDLEEEIDSSLEERDPVICIKSAVPPSITESLLNSYPELKITVSPEYLGEKQPTLDLIHQEALIVGGHPRDTNVVLDAFQHYSITNPRAKRANSISAVEASFIKYMENTFLALKVIYMNEMKILYDTFYNETNDEYFNALIPIHQLDSRMGGPYPSQIPGPDGHLGFGGKCLPKDLLTLLSEAEQLGIRLPLLEQVWNSNLEIRKDRNWQFIKGAVE